MKTFSVRVVICLLVGLPLYTHAGGCEYDTQCKGDRICEKGVCVAPQPASHAAEGGWSIWGNGAKSEKSPANPPYYCCTDHERLGPYANDGSEGKIFQVGDACAGMSRHARYVRGKVCAPPTP